MKSQLFIIGAILIIIFLFGIYSYLSLSNYVIDLKKPIRIDWNWKSLNKYRLIYNITSFTYTKFLNLSLPTGEINKSTIILFDNYPIKSQIDGNSIIFYDNLKPNEEKNIIIYYSNSSGETIKFDNIPLVDNNFILKNYNLTLSNNIIQLITNNGESNISCYNCLNSSGPVFVKFSNSTIDDYFFEDFAHIGSKDIKLTAKNYTNGSITYTCDGVQRHVDDKYGVFEGFGYFEFVNFSATINCSNNVWNISLDNPTYFLINSDKDEYGNRFFGRYVYSVGKEYVTDYFNRILSHYSKISDNVFDCGKRNAGLLNDFGDLYIMDDFVNNSFFSWNLSDNKFIYDNKNLGNGLIKLNGETLNYKKFNEKIIGNASCGNITMEFFNMSPVIYFKLNSNKICNLTLPVGIGVFYKDGSYYLVENNSYIVEYTGSILDGSKYPYFILRPNSSFYLSIILDKRDLNTPYFYSYNSLCPKI